MEEEDSATGTPAQGLEAILLVEAALFTAGKPIGVEEISMSTGLEPGLVPLCIKKLSQTYGRRDTSLEIIKAGKKFAIRVKESFVDRISSLAAPEISPKLLKTAALIAYHQPMKQSELVEMYGPKVYDHVKELSDLGLVRARKEGGTKVLSTTHRFSEVFGISSVSKGKVKGHVKERALEKIQKATLDVYSAEDEERTSGGEGGAERVEKVEEAENPPDQGGEEAPEEASSDEGSKAEEEEAPQEPEEERKEGKKEEQKDA